MTVQSALPGFLRPPHFPTSCKPSIGSSVSIMIDKVSCICHSVKAVRLPNKCRFLLFLCEPTKSYGPKRKSSSLQAPA